MTAELEKLDRAIRDVRRIADGHAAVGVDYAFGTSLEDVREKLGAAVQKLIARVNVFAAVETAGALRTRVAFSGSICSMIAASAREEDCAEHMGAIDAQWKLRMRVLQFVHVVFLALLAIPQVYANPLMAFGAVRRLIQVIEATGEGAA